MILRVKSALEQFLESEARAGVLLMFTALVAVAWANSPLSGSYEALKEIPLGLELAGVGLKKALILWVNDGLMAIFFFLVGLELKREMLQGELSDGRGRPSLRASLLPAAGALGGMLVPASLYVLINWGGTGMAGWGIPMATDIAFALGVLALLGSRVPLSLKLFLTALAVVDDLGAIVVIALFFTQQLSVGLLLLSLLAWGLAIWVGGRSWGMPLVLLLGILCWFFMLKSGVHATIAGVLMAHAIPLARVRHLEHALHPWVAYAILPVFALLNAGFALGDAGAISSISVGVLVGLVLGKPLGVVGGAWVLVRSGLASLPEGASWRGLIGVGILAGIGFTMSIFIGGLAFAEPTSQDAAKIGIISASVLAALAGLTWLARTYPAPSKAQELETV